MAKPTVLYGFCITPTHASAVKLSADDFSLQLRAEKSIPPGIIAHDGQSILDEDALLLLMRELVNAIGSPEFSDPVYLSIMPPFLTSQFLDLSRISSIRDELKSQVSNFDFLDSERPLLMHSLLWQHGETAAVACAVSGNQLINDYLSIFYKCGLKVEAVDILPLSVLRAMAASGVLDALLGKIGKQAYWGTFGVTGAQSWLSIWQGTRLMHIASFVTPGSKHDWEQKIQEFLALAGIEKTVVWLAWQDEGQGSPIDPLSLSLKSPVRAARLGPMYGEPPFQPSKPALGAALMSEIPFPLGWNFLSDPSSEPLKADYATVPYSNYQPVLPKLIFQGALAVFILVALATVYFSYQNARLDSMITERNTQLQRLLNDRQAENGAIPGILSWVSGNVVLNVSLESILIRRPDTFQLVGRSYSRELANDFMDQLSASQPQGGMRIVREKGIVNEADTVPVTYRFEYIGRMSYTPPQATAEDTQP